MSLNDEQMLQVRQEFERLGLKPEQSPWLGVSDLSAFLEHLRQIPAPATWRDIDPSLPAHWDMDDPATWTYPPEPYRPLGAFDYQTSPAGPAVTVAWPRAVGSEYLKELLSAARAAGMPVYGAGLLPLAENPEWPTREAHLVVQVDASDDAYREFLDWLDVQPGLSHWWFARVTDEEDEASRPAT